MDDFSDDPLWHVFYHAPLAYVVIDIVNNSQIVAANQRFCELLQYSPDDKLSMWDLIRPEDRDISRERIKAYLQGTISGRELLLQQRYLRRDGTEVWCRARVTASSLGDRPVVLAVVEDSAVATQLPTPQERTSHESSAMVAEVAHDLRQPLHVIHGLAELLTQADLDESGRQMAAAIVRETEGLTRTVGDLQEIGAVGAGSRRLRPRPMAVADLAERLDRAFAEPAQAKGLTFNVAVDANVPAVVNVDADRLMQVLQNGVSNAVKFTEAGFVRVTIAQTDEGTTFAVRDSGPGVDDVLAAFDPFRRGETDAPGSGLGLSIASTYVEQMGGQLTLENVADGGALFSFTLPLPIADETSDSGRSGVIEPLPEHLQDRRVLVVEDSLEVQMVTTKMLDSLGCFFYDMAADGAEALRMLDANGGDYAAVLMDWGLPGDLSGLEVIERWRRHEAENSLPRLPIIVVTARALAKDPSTCLDAGADAYLAKPASLSDLRSVLTTWMSSPDDEPVSTKPIFNPVKLEALLGQENRDGVHEILTVYLREQAIRMDALAEAHDAFTDNDDLTQLTVIEGIAHTTKSSSDTIGAMALSDLAADIEAETRAGDAPSSERASQLRRISAQTDAAIRSYLETIQS